MSLRFYVVKDYVPYCSQFKIVGIYSKKEDAETFSEQSKFAPYVELLSLDEIEDCILQERRGETGVSIKVNNYYFNPCKNPMD